MITNLSLIARKLARPALLLLLLVVPLESYLHNRWQALMAERSRHYLAPWAYASAQKGGVLVVGDSHANNTFQGSNLPDSIINAAFGSDGLRDAEIKLRTLIANGVVPRYLLLEADAHITAVAREPVNNENLVVLGTTTAIYNAAYGRAISHIKHWTLRQFPTSDVRNRNFLFLTLAEQARRALGVLGRPAARIAQGQTWESAARSERLRVVEVRRLELLGRSYTLSPVLRACWLRILKLCREQNITVIGIRYPHTPEYRAVQAQVYDVRSMNNLVRATPPDFLLDYSALFADAPNCFEDADHLSQVGGRRLAQLILSDIQNIERQKRRQNYPRANRRRTTA
jgi:hypothetical protein